MPRGKELEQLPMSNVAPGVGDDQSKMNRTSLNGIIRDETPSPSKVGTDKQTK